MPQPSSPAAELAREARVVGLRNFTTPSLEDVERRRWQLWSVAFFVLVGGAVATIGLSFLSDSGPVSAVLSVRWLRVAMAGVTVGFCLYTVEKEVHLRRLTRHLIDERVLTAALSNRLKEISSLSEVGKALNSVLDIDVVLGIILNSCLELLAGTEGSVMMLDEDRRTLVTVCCRGEAALLGAEQPLGTGVAGWVAQHREPLLLTGDADPHLFTELVPKDRGIVAALCVPLVSRDELLGVLNINETAGQRSYSEHDLRAMCLFAEHAAVAIANARLFQVEREHVARLLELDRLKSEFVATVSHELRTPLTSILGSAATLRRQGSTLTDGEREQFLGMIDRQGKRLLRLIEDILFAGRLEAGDTVVHAEQCDVAAIAADVVESYAAQPEGRRVRLVPPVGPLPVCSDPLAVHQIIQNLVDNALKYAPGSPIEVVARRDGAEVVVTIVDHGPGVAVADRDRIFERFRQGDGSITRAASGVGLGLYIVRNLVEGLDGRVWCDGEPGQGARFSFTLPTRTLEEVLQ